jgi:hypothetical protein
MNNTIPNNILIAQKELYSLCNLSYDQITFEKESQDYSACTFKLNDFSIKFRQAKITPTKIGQFVTCWKRSASQETMPFESTDDFDFLIIGANTNTQAGQFIFPKSALIQHKIVSTNQTEGKRGFRVYPAWDKPDNAQAKKTQLWQLPFFFDIHSKDLNCEKIKKLFSSINK